MTSLSFRIRCAVDAAERFLAQPEIYAAIGGGRPNSNVFSVTIAQMLKARQLRRRRATKAVRARCPGARAMYGPGPVPVFENACDARPPKRLLGFMELKRMRARARKARR